MYKVHSTPTGVLAVFVNETNRVNHKTVVNVLVVEEPEVAGVVAVCVQLRVRRVLGVGEAGVAVAILVDAGARRLQPQPWRWPWNSNRDKN